MLVRFVQLTIQPEKTEEFISVFKRSKPTIEGFEGCHKVELLQQNNDSRVFFTRSLWTDEAALNNYRHSDFFEATWRKTKTLFDAPAKAWSLTHKH